MKIFVILFVPFLLFAASPFDTPKDKTFNLSMFNTKGTLANKKAMKNTKILCRIVCDKKIYKEQRIAEAISFYKQSK